MVGCRLELCQNTMMFSEECVKIILVQFRCLILFTGIKFQSTKIIDKEIFSHNHSKETEYITEQLISVKTLIPARVPEELKYFY